MLPDPVWPVALLAVIQVIDGVWCLRPMPFIAQCLTDVRFPHRLWWLLSPLKFAAALGLVAGIWIPYLGVVTSAALVAYFVIAAVMHVAAKDIGRNLLVNCAGMLLLCLGTLVFSFVL